MPIMGLLAALVFATRRRALREETAGSTVTACLRMSHWMGSPPSPTFRYFGTHFSALPDPNFVFRVTRSFPLWMRNCTGSPERRD